MSDDAKIEATDEHVAAAHAFFEAWIDGNECEHGEDDDWCTALAKLLAERDRAAGQGVREACIAELEGIISCRDKECVCFDGDCERMKGVVETIRARSRG